MIRRILFIAVALLGGLVELWALHRARNVDVRLAR